MKQNLGQKATRSQQILFAPLITKRLHGEVIVIHHVIDTPEKLQLEIERRTPNGITFERIVL